MVKYGLYLSLNIKPEWKEYSISYDKLKTKIKQLKSKKGVGRGESIDKGEKSDLILEQATGSNNIIRDDLDTLDNILKSAFGKYVNEFLTLLNDEIKKFTIFFKKLEMEIYKLLSDRLEVDYPTLNIKDIINELVLIDGILDKVIDLSNFLNQNITAIRKILKKFDKNFSQDIAPIALHYLRKVLSNSNSYLVYILQFKIVDESSAIIDNLISDLEKVYTFKEKSLVNQKMDDQAYEPLLHGMHLKELTDIRVNNNYSFVDLLSKKFSELKDKLVELDEANNIIRSSLDTWTYILKCNVQTVNHETNENKKREHRYNFIECIENEKLLECLTPQMKDTNNLNPSAKTVMFNTWVILIHSFLYLTNCFIVYPTNYLFLEELFYPSYITGIVLAMTPLSSFLILPLFINNISFRYYKVTLIISIFILLLSNFFYIYAYFYRSLILMLASRILLGMGGLRILTNRYITEEIPSNLILFYSKLEYIIHWVGYACGPLLAWIVYNTGIDYHSNLITINKFTIPTVLCFFLWAFFMPFILIYFSDDSKDFKRENETYADKINNYSSNAIGYYDEEKSVIATKVEPSTEILNKTIVKNINRLVFEQETNISYTYVAYVLLITNILFEKMVVESLIIICPFILVEFIGLTIGESAIYLTILLVLVLPAVFILNQLKMYLERKVISLLLIVSFLSCLAVSSSYNIYCFCSLFSLVFLSAVLIENLSFSLFAKIVPEQYFSKGFFNNSDFYILLATKGGTFLGGVFITLIGFAGKQISIYSLFFFFATVYVIFLFFFYFKYSELRVKAIARVIKKIKQQHKEV